MKNNSPYIPRRMKFPYNNTPIRPPKYFFKDHPTKNGDEGDDIDGSCSVSDVKEKMEDLKKKHIKELEALCGDHENSIEEFERDPSQFLDNLARQSISGVQEFSNHSIDYKVAYLQEKAKNDKLNEEISVLTRKLCLLEDESCKKDSKIVKLEQQIKFMKKESIPVPEPDVFSSNLKNLEKEIEVLQQAKMISTKTHSERDPRRFGFLAGKNSP